MDEDIADLSAWLGKPPERTIVSRSAPSLLNQDEQIPDTPQSPRSIQSRSDSRSSSTSNDTIEVIPTGDWIQRRHESVSSSASDSDVVLEETMPSVREPIQVNIPILSQEEKEGYEDLPGHSVVKKILGRSGEHMYIAELESEETILIQAQSIEDLDNGAEALEDFQNKEPLSEGRRETQKPNVAGMVDWTNVDLSDIGSEEEEHVGQTIQTTKDDVYESSNEEVATDEEEDAEATDDSKPGGRRSSRLASSRKRTVYRDEVVELTDSDDEAPRRSRRPKAPPQRGPKSLRVPEAAASRRSERTRTKPHRSMREKNEDEISSHSEDEVGPKIVTTKEVFYKFPEDDPFKRRHRQDCATCGHSGYSSSKGPIVYCQGCTFSYHKSCLGHRGTREHLVTKVDEGHFVLQCRMCVGAAHTKDSIAPHLGQCAACNSPGLNAKPLRTRLTTRQEQLQREENSGTDPITVVDPNRINNAEHLFFRCGICYRGWHMHHLPERVTAHSQMDDDDEEHMTEQELAQKRYELYHRSWRCKDCIENNKTIDALIAWRPVNQDSYVPGIIGDLMQESQKEYLVKWRMQSYLRTTWMPGSWVWSVAAQNMRSAFMKRVENALPKMTTKDAIPEDCFRIDIVFDVKYNSVVRNSSKEIDFARIKEVESAYVKYKGLGFEDAIWEKPPVYTDTERFNDFKTAYEDYVTKVYMSIPPQSTLRRRMLDIRGRTFDQLSKDAQPSIMVGGSLMQYQLDGLNWLYYQWFRGQNAILADEMGLGKTIQLIAFFATLVQEHKCWPFLIVVPNSTCPNWRREIKKWTPSLRAVTYYGSERARKLTQDFELFPKDKEKQEHDSSQKKARPEVKDIKAHIVIASYESISEEKTRKSLMRVPWQGLVVDEGQRLKNDKNLVYEALTKFRFPFKVLLTGTPLQNNPRELFNLIQFLDRSHNAAELEAKYSELTSEKVPELHELLRPFFLRRTKVQVLTFLPPMAQIIVPVTMSTVQKKVCKSILAKNPHLMKSIFSRESLAQKDRANLNNMLMQLRKTLCHPFVYSREIEERTPDTEVAHRNLVEASSKLQLLQIMLPKLQERGHRVLMFSQFLDNLDIVEDFLDGLGMLHRRLDGTINASEKQKRIDEYNAPGSPYFAFLLSTRAGGVGINLATADTVIILDPDFNPHQDIQALSRAHRIGQQNKVLVFQLMTRNSAEEKIMQIGKKKMALDHVLIERMDQEDDAGENLESILKYGAQSLFEDTEEHDIIYDSASVDRLLDRSQMESTKISDDKSAESQFSFARIWANNNSTLEDNLQDAEETGANTPDPGIWDKILAEREQAYQEELARKEQALGRGKRKREKIDYHDRGYKKSAKEGSDRESTDGDFEAVEKDGEAHITSSEDDSEQEKPRTVRARPFKRVKVPVGEAPHFNGDGPSNYVPKNGLPPPHDCSACGDKHPMGWCRLKIAGVEHCGLCGLAHIGYGRTCPHLNDEKQVETLLATLKESTESRELIEEATKYLRLIRSDLISRRREREKKEADANARMRPILVGQQNSFPQPLPPPLARFGPAFSHTNIPPNYNRPRA